VAARPLPPHGLALALSLWQKGPQVTKKDLAKKIAEAMGINQLLALEIVQMTFDGIIETLVNEGRIELRNFGVFEVKQRQPREARNPRTGDKVMVPPRLVVTFKPGREMEERVAVSNVTPVNSKNEKLATPEAPEEGEPGE
jgi:nucleoid DNA-binding protein